MGKAGHIMNKITQAEGPASYGLYLRGWQSEDFPPKSRAPGPTPPSTSPGPGLVRTVTTLLRTSLVQIRSMNSDMQNN